MVEPSGLQIQEPIAFKPSTPLTLGVELEFQLIDKQRFDLAPRAVEILNEVPAGLEGRIKPEFIRSMIEVNTRICSSVAEAAVDLEAHCRLLEALAGKHDCLLFASSLHPFAVAHAQQLSPNSRYHRIMEELQLVGRRFITQGLHVHVGLPDGETAIRVCDAIRIHLPILLALSTSSPFYQGEDTGLHSYRAKLFEALPLAGIPDYYETWDNFQRVAHLLLATGIIQQTRDLWWDVRPHPDFGTIEVRICDLPSRFSEIIGLVALIQALVARCSKSQFPAEDANMQILRSNKWQAARYGLGGHFVDPFGLQGRTMAEAALDLLAELAPFFDELATASYLAPLREVLERGTSAHRQRLLYHDSNDFRSMIETIRSEFWL